MAGQGSAVGGGAREGRFLGEKEKPSPSKSWELLQQIREYIPPPSRNNTVAMRPE
jgi:hypothetical protein